MLLGLVVLLVEALIAISVGYVLVIAARNYQRYKFFKLRSPNLPFIKEGYNLFGGHANSLVNTKSSWSKINKVFDKYGTTVAFFYGDRPSVFTKDLDFIKAFTLDEQVHNNRPNPRIPIVELDVDNVGLAEDKQWVRMRKAIAPAFSHRKIVSDNVLEEINGSIDKLVGLIELKLIKAKSERNEDLIEEDVDHMAQRFALDLVLTCFYKQNQIVNFKADKDKFVKLMHKGFENVIGLPIKLCAAFPILNRLFSWLIGFIALGAGRDKITDFIAQQMNLHFEAKRQAAIKRGEKDFNPDNFKLDDGSRFKANMVDHIIDQYCQGKLTKREFVHSTFLLFFAASKTVSDAISMVLYHLACNPTVQDKLRESLLTYGTESEYLSWVMNESLRLYPPITLGCARTIERDFQTKHGLIPKGTAVFTPAYTIHRLKEYWGEDADTFRPERWVDAKSFHPAQFIPFGLGKRSCPGKDLATLEIKMLLNVLLSRYKFSRSERTSDLIEFDAPMFVLLVFDNPIYVNISRVS